METLTLTAEVRAGRGKGPARRLRMHGQIPAIFYGPGIDPTPLAVHPKELARTLMTGMGRNAVIRLSVDGREELCMVKDLEIHPVTRKILHADFYRVAEDRPLIIEIPIRTEGRAPGVAEGGRLNIAIRALPIRTLPTRIPPSITVDVSALELNRVIQVKDLALDPTIEVLLSENQTIVSCTEERRPALEEEAAAAAVEGAEGEAAAAPAEGAEGEEGKEKGDKDKDKEKPRGKDRG